MFKDSLDNKKIRMSSIATGGDAAPARAAKQVTVLPVKSKIGQGNKMTTPGFSSRKPAVKKRNPGFPRERSFAKMA